jgi:mortality factor 4-like protein 1
MLTDKFIHSWDDWVPQDRLRKLTDDNRELANNLKRDLVQTQPTRTSAKPAGSSRKGKGQGSDLGSGRGSEERHSSVPAGGRGTKRGKDNDVEKVGSFCLFPRVPLNDLLKSLQMIHPWTDAAAYTLATLVKLLNTATDSSEKDSSGSRTTALVTFL